MNVLEKYRLRYYRQVARQCWIEANGDSEQALNLFRDRVHGLSPEVIAILVDLAIKLFKLWIDRNKPEPSEVMDAEESEIMGCDE